MPKRYQLNVAAIQCDGDLFTQGHSAFARRGFILWAAGSAFVDRPAKLRLAEPLPNLLKVRRIEGPSSCLTRTNRNAYRAVLVG
jgi:hypothetical protein